MLDALTLPLGENVADAVSDGAAALEADIRALDEGFVVAVVK